MTRTARPPAIFRIGPYASAIDRRIAAVEVQLVECVDHARDDVEWFPQCVEVYDDRGNVLDVGTVTQLDGLACLAWDVVESRVGTAVGDTYRVQIRPAVLVREVRP